MHFCRKLGKKRLLCYTNEKGAFPPFRRYFIALSPLLLCPFSVSCLSYQYRLIDIRY